MATNNFYNHENGIYVIKTTTFEQMKEWMETDEFFEWTRDDDGNVRDEDVWEQVSLHAYEEANEWIYDFKHYLEIASSGKYDVIINDSTKGKVYNMKTDKLVAELEVRSGYYDGYQVIVETDPYELLDGYFSNKTELLEQYTPNHEMLLKYLGKHTRQLERVGQFSNGEAVYSYL